MKSAIHSLHSTTRPALIRLAIYLLFASIVSDSTAVAQDTSPAVPGDAAAETQTATFGAGCFWCSEAVFQRVKGVEKVVSGFMGGRIPNPTYQMVLTGQTGHAEVIQVTYNPQVVSYEKLLEIFWKTHDPTTLNRQGVDIGTQYRSAIFYHSQEQQSLAEKYKQLLDESEAFARPIVTEITKAGQFYPAEDYHQNYYNLNKTKNSYCQQIKYKLAKFRKVFPEELDKSKDKVK